jgi:hypothetical protein
MIDYPIGTILLLEMGEYSDKCTYGPFKVMKDIDATIVKELFLEECGCDQYPSDVCSWLAKNDYISDVENSSSWFLGTSSAFNE